MFRIITIVLLFLISSGNESRCVVHLESVDYPVIAVSARVQGCVHVNVEVAPDGTITSASADSGPPMLREAAEENIKKWVFSRGPKGKIEIVYEFKLKRPEMDIRRVKNTFELPGRVIVISNFLQPDH